MIENKIPEINVEEIMERFREEVKLLKQQNYNLNELLKYHDTDFITNAYKAILGRTPDTNGLDYYLKQLRNGELCKADILEDLRFSPEGRKISASIESIQLSSCPELAECPGEQPVPELPDQQNYSLKELYKYHDADFITNAYKAILGRTPDTNGLDYYLKQLRNGELCKAEILGHLRFSPEGRQKKISMKGLFIPFIFHRSLKTPVLGKVLRIFVGRVNLPAILRKIQLENYRK